MAETEYEEDSKATPLQILAIIVGLGMAAACAVVPLIIVMQS